jgi:hypothetical protein
MKKQIWNTGGVPVTNFWVTVASASGKLGGQVWRQQITESLLPGEMQSVSLYITELPERGDTALNLVARVDPDNRVLELSDDNNLANLPIVHDHRGQSSGGTVTGGCD